MPNTSRSTMVFHTTARLVISLARDSLENLAKTYPGVDAIDLLICFAVLVGSAERRPMGHAKLAEFCGIPRPTVVRRVKRLVANRLLEFSDDGKTVVTPKYRLTGEIPLKMSMKYVRLIKKAAEELSKMDTK